MYALIRYTETGADRDRQKFFYGANPGDRAREYATDFLADRKKYPTVELVTFEAKVEAL